MNCFIRKFSTYDFRGIYQCLPSNELMKDYISQLGNYISSVITPHIVNFCKPYQEPIICPPTNCTECLSKQVIQPIENKCFDLEKNKFVLTAVAIGTIAIPTIYFLGKKIFNMCRSKVHTKNLMTHPSDTEVQGFISQSIRPSTDIKRDKYTVLNIPNIFSLSTDALKRATAQSNVSFDTERGKIKVSINCRGLTSERFERLLEDLFETYSQIDHIEFESLDLDHEKMLNKLKKYHQIKALTFKNSLQLEQKHLIALTKSSTSIRSLTFVNTNMDRITQLEQDCLITYSDKTNNLETMTRFFVNEIHELFDPFERARTPSDFDAASVGGAAAESISNEDIAQFIKLLNNKKDFPIFSSPDVFLDFSEIKNVNDYFLINFLKFLKDNDLYISGIDLSNNDTIEGSFLIEGESIGIKTLILSNTKINSANLKFLRSYPKLKNLDLSYLKLDDKDLKELYLLQTLKILNLNNCQNLSKNSLFTFIITKLSSLEFVSIEGTKLDDKQIKELLAYPVPKPFMLVYNDEKDNRFISINLAQGIRNAIFHHLLKIKGDINSLTFSKGSELSITDIDKLSRIPAFVKLETLDLSNVTIVNNPLRTIILDKKYNPLMNLKIWEFKNLIFHPFKIKIERSKAKKAKNIEIAIENEISEDQLDFLIKYFKTFDEISEISFKESQHLNKHVLEEISKIAIDLTLKLLDLSFTNIDESTLQKESDEKPHEYLLKLFQTLNCLNIEGIKSSLGEAIDETSFLAGLNVESGSERDPKNTRRASIYPNKKVEIILNSSRKNHRIVEILPTIKDSRAGAAGAAEA